MSRVSMSMNQWVALATAWVFVVGYVVATATPGPLLTADDLANFGMSHAIAGQGAVPMPAQPPYGPLYPILLAPGWLFGLDESGMLVWARGINAACGALLVPVLFAFVRRVTDAAWPAALSGAVAGAILPAGLLTSSIAWSERLLWLLVALAALAVVRAGDRRSSPTAALAVLSAIGLYAGHPRLGPAAVVVIVVAAWSVRRLGWVSMAAAIGAGAAGLWLVERIRGAAASAAFDDAGTYDAADLASRRGLDLVPQMSQHALGAVTYLVLAGTLLAVWGFVVLVRHRPAWPVLAMAAAIVAVAAWFLTGIPRADKWLHGRYIEVLAPLFVAVGLAMLDRLRWKLALALGFALPALGGVIAAWNGPGNTWNDARSPVMMFGVEVSGAPYGGQIFEPGAAASVAIVAGMLTWMVARRAGVARALVIVVALTAWAVDSGDATLDSLFVNTAAGEVDALLPSDEVIGEVFVDIETVSPNLTNAVAWELGFDRTVLNATRETTHLLIPIDANPPAGSTEIASFSQGVLWRLG